jgi:hypothetical protein
MLLVLQLPFASKFQRVPWSLDLCLKLSFVETLVFACICGFSEIFFLFVQTNCFDAEVTLAEGYDVWEQ